VAKEMAEERDRFLVSDDNGPGWIEKHCLRFQAVANEISILNLLTRLDLTGYAIVPIFIPRKIC
jgi:hypothetical protein